jgi:hypothetical protein
MDVITAVALSVHLGLTEPYNGVHPHIRVEESAFIAGAYINSLTKLSAYAGVNVNLSDHWFIDVGYVTGYGSDIPVFARFGYTQDGVNIFMAPAYETDNPGIVLGFEYELR